MAASREAINLPHVPVVGPGSGEGVGKLFYSWDPQQKKQVQHTPAAILSVGEINTLAALKARSASTLLPELNKAWMGEELGFAYSDRTKRLDVPPHGYRLCMVAGIQPANANVLLDDVDSGTPARWLWMPTSDHAAPTVRPTVPPVWNEWRPRWGDTDRIDPTALRPMEVCQTAWDAVDVAAFDRLHEISTDAYNSHALLSRLKTAATLALLDNRPYVVTEEDWQLAGIVHDVSDTTRQRMIDLIEQTKIKNNRVRAEAEASRTILIGNRVAEATVQRVGRAIMRKLDSDKGDWISRSKLRGSLDSKDRGYFEGAIEALKTSGQVEERELEADHKGNVGTEYRRAR
jgi:hypothetical protein